MTVRGLRVLGIGLLAVVIGSPGAAVATTTVDCGAGLTCKLR